MSNTHPPWRIEEIFFPVQEVHANPRHDPNDERTETVVSQAFSVQAVNEGSSSFGAYLELSCDEEESYNPRYFFALHAYTVLTLNPDVIAQEKHESLAQLAGHRTLIGAARERLLDLTSRAPWGRLMLGAMVLPSESDDDDAAQSVD